MDEEELNLIHQVNPNIFGKDIMGIELKNCPNCHKLMEFNNEWECDCKN